MDKYTQDLIAYAKGEIKEFEIPDSYTAWTKEQIEVEIERIKTHPTKADILKDFLNFLGNESSKLHNFACEFAHFTHQQAWNYVAEGPVGKAAGELRPEASKSLLRRSPPTRPRWIPLPMGIQTLKGHTGWVNAVSITPDEKHAISGSDDLTCILWDLHSGDAIKTLKGHTSRVSAVSITPDGKNAISGSYDNTCILWDLYSGDAIKSLKGHNDRVNAVSITPNGKYAISGSNDNTCILWELKTGKQIVRVCTNSDIYAVKLYSEGVVLGCYSGEVVILNTAKEIICPGLPITIARLIWDFELQKFLPISTDCPLCGHRLAPPTSVLTTIDTITKKAGLRPEQSPCLELPKETWEEPGLLSNCPKCGGDLKFNPFIA
jgi:WD40 repeat protein